MESRSWLKVAVLGCCSLRVAVFVRRLLLPTRLGVSENKGCRYPLLGSLYKDPTIEGAILGSPILGTPQMNLARCLHQRDEDVVVSDGVWTPLLRLFTGVFETNSFAAPCVLFCLRYAPSFKHELISSQVIV